MDGFLLESRFGFLGARPDEVRGDLAAEGWRKARSVATTTLWIRGDLDVRDVAGGWVVGALFERGSGRPAPLSMRHLQGDDLRADTLVERLVRSFWGRYVALLPAERAVLRDPSGHLDALVWHSPTAWIVASDFPDTLPPGLAPRIWGLDWSAIAGMVQDETAIASTLGLHGLDQVRPGSLRSFTHAPVDKVVWNPSDFAARPHASYEASRGAVIAAVEESLTAEAGSGDGLLAEISGGLDSAVVATTLARIGAGERARFVHFHVDEPAADERRFARAVAERAKVDLSEIVKPELRIDEQTLATMPVGVRPSNNAMDRHYDRSLSDLVRQCGARRILTGQGGDMVFYQAPSPKVSSELWGRWARRPAADPVLRQLEDVARWNRRSTWSLLGEAVRDAVVRREVGRIDHPWLARPVAPAKRRQITSLIQAQALFNGASLRGRQAQLVHPLLHQPVLEAVLAAPVVDLARGGRGRSLARDAFGAQLPDIVRRRRSKGDLTAYYGRMVLRSLETLKPYLLEGRLAAERVLDGKAVDEGLDPDRMIHEGNYPRLFQIIALEAFVRHWEGRVASIAATAEAEGEASRSASHGNTSA